MTGARFRHLQAFAAIAEFGSAQRAADAIGLTQPAVTHLVADLEEFLQCPLFHRHARGMRMTDMARELLPFVQRSLATLEAGTQFVAFRQSSGHSIVRVGAIHGAINGLLVRALPAFGQSKPDILVQLQEANAAESSALIWVWACTQLSLETDALPARETALCAADTTLSNATTPCCPCATRRAASGERAGSTGAGATDSACMSLSR